MLNNEEYVEIENESGLFTIDKNGWLISFDPNIDHELRNRCLVQGLNINNFKFCLNDLIIPEGVRFIGNDWMKPSKDRFEDFWHILVLDEVSLPTSLLAIMPNSFSGSVINSILLPKNLKQIGVASFLHSKIFRLDIEKSRFHFQYRLLNAEGLMRVPEDLMMYGGRSFKESVIGELRIFCKEGTVSIRDIKTDDGRYISSRIMPEADVGKVSVLPIHDMVKPD
ncbi:MAG: leucine-rich repeat protein [Ruminococcus sp.]|nr:leucine-rich repeat protein [Ruminococcus sp.]